MSASRLAAPSAIPKSIAVRLTVRQRRFALWWVRLGQERGKGAEAARRAGYKDSPCGAARTAAVELKRHPIVREAIKAISEYLEDPAVIDERWILNGLSREAAESEQAKDRINALGLLAKIRQLGSFGGVKDKGNAASINQLVVLAGSLGFDAGTGAISDANKFSAAITRAFGAAEGAVMLQALGLVADSAPQQTLNAPLEGEYTLEDDSLSDLM